MNSIAYSVSRPTSGVSEKSPDDSEILRRVQIWLHELAGKRAPHESKEMMWSRVARHVGLSTNRVRDLVYGEAKPTAYEYLHIQHVAEGGAPTSVFRTHGGIHDRRNARAGAQQRRVR